MGKFEDIVEEVRELDELLGDKLEPFKTSNLRNEAKRAGELEAENAALKALLIELEEAPKREKAFKDYGVDLSQLKPAEKELLKTLKLEGELTAEKVGEIVQHYELPMTEGSKEEEEEPPAAEVVARAAQSGGKAAHASTLTAADMESWTTEKLMRFREKYPEEFEALKREQSVTGAFSV